MTTQPKWYTLYLKLDGTDMEQQITEEVTKQYRDTIYYQKPHIQASNALIPAGIMRLELFDTVESIVQKFQGQSWFRPDLIKDPRYYGFSVPCDSVQTETQIKEEVMREYKEVCYYDRPQFMELSTADCRLYVELRDTVEDIIQKFSGKPWFNPSLLKTSGVKVS